MTTIVRHKRTGNEYILLGINGEENKVNPSRFISELFTAEKSEVSYSATVCDVRGNLFLAYIDDLIVTEIDGQKPADILPVPVYSAAETVENESNSPEDREFDDDRFDEDDELEDEDTASNNGDFDTGDRPPLVDLQSPVSSNYEGDSTTQNDFDRDDDDDDWV